MRRAASALIGLTAVIIVQTGCAMLDKPTNFGQDVQFLKRHTDVIVLGDEPGGARVAVVPKYQGRVMTSTTSGDRGASNGFINYELIRSGKTRPHINVFGGEDRFWMGPEGGQFAIFFKHGDPFELDAWQTPAVIDTAPYEVVSHDARSVSFRHKEKLKNYSDTEFEFQIDRIIRLIPTADVASKLGVQVPAGVRVVAYESSNKLTNMGRKKWTKESGLLSVWILGMFKHSADTTVAIPYRVGSEEALGPVVNDAYFGKVPADRLRISEVDRLIYFKGDGACRSKIGLSPSRATAICGSYTPSANRLTIVQYNKPEGAADYVNSMWELQKEPYRGDVINSYNDGPPSPGAKPMGPFYELETSSPAKELGRAESVLHVHRTFHFEGAPQQLSPIAESLLGVRIERIEAAWR
ncbi:MAG: hypothetical protein CHACPFDD_03823 [Phycisphaerae bacterium]|nr:hypothetical protein [Phycisphaerae bacterium]